MATPHVWIARPLAIGLFVFVAVLATTISAQGLSGCEGSCTDPVDGSGRTGWTGWSSDWNAAAADGDGFWLAFDGGILRWRPDEGVVERITAVQGLPHLVVHDIAMDAADGFWISGDAGISHRDSEGAWTHYPVAWAPSPNNEHIVTGANGSVWFQDVDGQVHHRKADGDWVTHADLFAAVESDFSAALTKIGQSTMWLVAFDEIWVGYEAYDGDQWHTRLPADPPVTTASMESGHAHDLAAWPTVQVATLVAMRQDGDGMLYAPTVEHPSKWNGLEWQSMDDVSYYSTVLGFFAALDGSLWQAYFFPTTPTSSMHQITNLMGDGGTSFRPFTINDLIATENSLWFFSPGIIRHVSSDTQVGTVEYPFSENRYVSALRSTGDGQIIISPGWSPLPFNFTRWLTTVDDGGTPPFDDDTWKQFAEIFLLEAWEVAPDQSIWYVSGEFFSSAVRPPAQWIDGTTIQYPATWPVDQPSGLSAFSVANDQTILIAFSPGPVVRLHNGGTPSDFSDDHWDRFDLPDGMKAVDMAQDSAGLIWIIDADGGTHKQSSGGWTPILDGQLGNTLVPAADGTLLIAGRSDLIPIIHSDGRIDTVDITDLVSENPDLMRTAQRANSRWAVGADETIWFSRKLDSESPELVRRSEHGLAPYPLPPLFAGSGLAVDRYDQVWLLHDDTLWRFSPLPDYEVSLSPRYVLVEPGDLVQGTLTIVPSEGFSETVALAIAPGDLDFTLGSTTASVNRPIQFSVSAPDSTGEYDGYVTGTAGMFERTGGLQVVVVENLQSLYLPIVQQIVQSCPGCD